MFVDANPPRALSAALMRTSALVPADEGKPDASLTEERRRIFPSGRQLLFPAAIGNAATPHRGFLPAEKLRARIYPTKKTGAFSLVEVVLALGIVAFVMVSVLGLMSVGIKANKESAEDLAVGLITQHISSTLRLEGFNAVSANSNYADTEADFYFDGNGSPTDQNSKNGTYACTITQSTPATAPVDGMLFLKVEIAWPLQAPAANRTKQIIQMSLASRE